MGFQILLKIYAESLNKFSFKKIRSLFFQIFLATEIVRVSKR